MLVMSIQSKRMGSLPCALYLAHRRFFFYYYLAVLGALLLFIATTNKNITG